MQHKVGGNNQYLIKKKTTTAPLWRSHSLILVAKLPEKCVVDSFAPAKLTVLQMWLTDKEHSDSSDEVVTDFNTYTESFGKHRLGEKVREHPEHRCALRTTEKPPQFVWMKTANWGQELASCQTNARTSVLNFCIKGIVQWKIEILPIYDSPWCRRRLWSHVLTRITKRKNSTQQRPIVAMYSNVKKTKTKNPRRITQHVSILLCCAIQVSRKHSSPNSQNMI